MFFRRIGCWGEAKVNRSKDYANKHIGMRKKKRLPEVGQTLRPENVDVIRSRRILC